MKNLFTLIFVATLLALAFSKEESKEKQDIGTVIGIDLGK